ncbi:MAG: biopolymer transporter ExbB [Rhodobacterales bacterium]|nr:biopolymer transporter ExbB [Rhodobacterales bacterium]
MTDKREPEAEPRFSQPIRQITSMLIVVALVAAGFYVIFDTVVRIFWNNPYLDGVIFGVFFLGVLACFRQMFQIMHAVSWIGAFAHPQPGREVSNPPSLLAPLATLLRSRGSRMQLSSSSSRSILESVAQRIDEDREITRYLSNTLIFLGLLGTFFGLATTVPALVDTIKSLNPQAGESGADIFARLQLGLQTQLSGMGTAFSSSLLGLFGSMIIGLLELFASHGQNRFYRELEEWLSSITRVSFSSGEEGGTSSDATMMAQVIDHLAEQMESLQLMFTQTDIARSQSDERMGELSQAISRLANRMDQTETNAALMRIAEGQERLIAVLSQSGGGEGMDAESRMRLRSIDVQLLRILEEISAGRQETVADLRTEIATLTRAVRGAGAPRALRDTTQG